MIRAALGRRVPEPKQHKQTMIDTLKRAFELNRFDYMAADALALTYNVSGLENAELTTLWEGRRDKAMSDISINMECATKNNRLLSYACERTTVLNDSLLFQSSNLSFVHTCRSWDAQPEDRASIYIRVRALASRCGVNARWYCWQRL